MNLMTSLTTIITGQLILFLLATTSNAKTKRSKKDGIIHVTSRQAGDDSINDDVSALMRITSITPHLTGTGCDHGCPECNAYSGCTRCRRGMYLTLVQDGRVTRAVCVHKCPAGYFGEKTPTSGICQSCRVSNCKACFHRSYCTVCEPGFFLHLGKCESNCPGHLFSNNHTGKCEEAVDCVVSPWTAFGKCNPSRRPNAMSCKYGRKKRNRTILQPPSPGGAKCPKLTHSRKCRVTDCPPINNWARNEWIKMKRRKERRKQREGRRRNRNRNEISNNSAAKLVRKNRRKSHKKRKSSTSST